MFYNLHFNKASSLLHTKTLSCSDLTITTETGHNSQFLQCFHFSIGFYQLEMISCIARNGKLELNIYFQFQKFSLITSQKLNICTAAKMKHSPNIKNQNLNFSTKYTEPWIQKKFYHQTWVGEVVKHYIFFCKILGNYKRKIVFPPERKRKRKFGEDQNLGAAAASISQYRCQYFKSRGPISSFCPLGLSNPAWISQIWEEEKHCQRHNGPRNWLRELD